MPKKELEEMVRMVKSLGFLHDERVERAMLSIDRGLFIPKDSVHLAYYDCALPTTSGQTISAPTIVAFMLENLDVGPGMKILEIGTGSGYNAALLAELVGKKGKVVSIELVPELCRYARSNIRYAGKDYQQLKLICGDGTMGYKGKAPYDRICITAALPQAPDQYPFFAQLKKDGKLIAPVGDGRTLVQNLILYDNKMKKTTSLLPVLFVPLVEKKTDT